MFSRCQSDLLFATGNCFESCFCGKSCHLVTPSHYLLNLNEVDIFVEVDCEDLVNCDIIPDIILFELPDKFYIVDFLPFSGRDHHPYLNLDESGWFVHWSRLVCLYHYLVYFAQTQKLSEDFAKADFAFRNGI